MKSLGSSQNKSIANYSVGGGGGGVISVSLGWSIFSRHSIRFMTWHATFDYLVNNYIEISEQPTR